MAWSWPCSAPVFQVGLHLVVVAGECEHQPVAVSLKEQPQAKTGATFI